MHEEKLTFSYTYNNRVLAACVSIAFCLSLGFAYFAYFDDQELKLARLFSLDPGAASILHWAVSCMFAFAGAFFGVVWLTRHRFPRSVVIGSEEFTAPTSRWPFSMKHLTIRYDSITRMQVFRRSGFQVLRISYSKGKIELDAIRFDSNAAFLELYKLILHRCSSED